MKVMVSHNPLKYTKLFKYPYQGIKYIFNEVKHIVSYGYFFFAGFKYDLSFLSSMKIPRDK